MAQVSATGAGCTPHRGSNMTLPPGYAGQTLAWPLRFGTIGSVNLRASDSSLNSTAVSQPTMIMKQTYTAPLAAVTNGYSVAHVGQVAAGTINMTLGGSLAVAGVGINAHHRNAVITVTHATAVVAMSGVITGNDRYGRIITEAWAVTATGVSKTYTGVKAFAKITSITEVNAADCSANTIIAGSGVVLGLDFRTASIKLIYEQQDAVVVTTGVLTAGAGVSATLDYRGTYTPAAAPNGVIVWAIYFLTDDPTDIGTTEPASQYVRGLA